VRARRPAGSRLKPRPTRRRSGAAVRGTTFGQVRAAALGLPGVQDGRSYGTPALKVRGKLLARVHQSLDCLVLRADLVDRQILMQAAPDTFFITEHYRDAPWVLVRFAEVEASELPGLLERAWRLVAPARLVKEYDAQPGAPRPLK
jgi:hypothetical protein